MQIAKMKKVAKTSLHFALKVLCLKSISSTCGFGAGNGLIRWEGQYSKSVEEKSRMRNAPERTARKPGAESGLAGNIAKTISERL